MSAPIRLIVTDIDGCLGPGEAQPYDFSVLMALAQMNRAARRGEPVPAITLCTGRSAAYVDAMMQTIDGFLPAIYENGAGMYIPQGYRFAWNPAISAETRRAMRQVRELLEEQVVNAGIGYLQPGKESSLTFLPMPGFSLDDVGRAALKALDGRSWPFCVEVSVTTVGIWPEGIDKGVGLKWLAESVGLPLAQAAGVGDAEGDICFLEMAGFSAAPANAEPKVKAAVDYVSPLEQGQGLLDIIEHLEAAGWLGRK